jgi:hypothetical protein
VFGIETFVYVVTAFGGLILATIGLLPGIVRWWRRRRSRVGSAERIVRRLATKENIEQNLPSKSKWGNRGDATVRDVYRVDDYPNTDGRTRGISSWFKVELKDLYHRGIEVFIGIEYIQLDERRKTWRSVRKSDADLKGFIVGRIPFDWIAEIDWDGDEYYGGPHIYCRYIGKHKQPYEDIVVYYKERGDDFLWLLNDYTQARRPPRMLRRFARSFRKRGTERV